MSSDESTFRPSARTNPRMLLELLRATVSGAASLEDKVARLQALRADATASQALDQTVLGEIARLHGGLEQAQQNIAEMRGLLQTLTAPPQFPAIFLGSVPEQNLALVVHGTGRRVVAVAEDVDASTLHAGDEVLLGHQLNVLLARSPFGAVETGEVGVFEHWLPGGRALLRSRDEEFIVQMAAQLDGTLKSGDHVLWSRELRMALQKTEHAEKRELFVEETPGETFDSIGGLDRQIDALKAFLSLHVFHAHVARRYGLEPKRGITLHGPPGTGKTLLARALANWVATLSASRRSRFINVKPGQLNTMWYGETERKIRDLFRLARQVAEQEPDVPVVIYFDEIDSIGASRAELRHSVEARVLNALMAELDGFSSRGNVVVLAATNRLDVLDEALVRPGRLGDERIEIGRPNRAAASQILAKHLPKEIPYAGTGASTYEPARMELIDACTAQLYAPNGAATLATLMLRDGSQRPVLARDLVNGAILAKVAADARSAACRREIESGEPGVRIDDVMAAVSTQLETMADALTPRSAHRYLTDLPQDAEVVRVQRTRRPAAMARVYRYIQAA